MEFFEAIVALFGMVVGMFFIACSTAIVIRWITTRGEVAKARALAGPDTVAAQISELRQEVRQLREQNADVILSFDNALQRLGPGAVHPVRTTPSAHMPPVEAERVFRTG